MTLHGTLRNGETSQLNPSGIAAPTWSWAARHLCLRTFLGAPATAFRDYFNKAKIFGADIDSEILFSEKRIKTYKVDQCSIDSMENLFKKKIGKNFDLIIDDGLHAPYTNINFILACLNKVKKNGWLIIEDIPFKTKPIWSIINLILSKNEKCFIVKTKNCYVFCINKKA